MSFWLQSSCSSPIDDLALRQLYDAILIVNFKVYRHTQEEICKRLIQEWFREDTLRPDIRVEQIRSDLILRTLN